MLEGPTSVGRAGAWTDDAQRLRRRPERIDCVAELLLLGRLRVRGGAERECHEPYGDSHGWGFRSHEGASRTLSGARRVPLEAHALGARVSIAF
jgi:hypothetical protein